jgi:hypothetical protein
MMKSVPQNRDVSYNNVLYVGDEPKACITVIEKFNNMLQEIENIHKGWFIGRYTQNKFSRHDRLRYHIHYHFEGGVVVFNFNDEDELPAHIRAECLNACKSLNLGQLGSIS